MADRRGASLVTVGIVASRLMGFVRQAALAHFLGTGATADALTAAFRVGNITQNLLGDGTLGATFVPIYVRLRRDSDELASKFSSAMLGALVVASTVLSTVGILAAAPLTRAIASGLDGEAFDLAVVLVRILFPMTGLLVLSAWALAVLTSHRRFLFPYMAPLVWSGSQLVALWVSAVALKQDLRSIAIAVGWGALIGAALQFALLAGPAARRSQIKRPTFDFGSSDVRQALRRLPSAVLGRGVLLLSGLVDTSLVTLLGVGALSSFQYAQTAYLLPMAILGAGEAAASLPELADKDVTSEAERGLIAESLRKSLGRVLHLSVFSAFVFLFGGEAVIRVLFERGAFDASSTRSVAAVLAVYALGLPANAAARILSVTCFALGDTARPARYATARVVLSTALALVLMWDFGPRGVVAGATAAAWLEVVLLARRVRSSLGTWSFLGQSWGKLVGVGAIAVATGGAAMSGLAMLGLGPVLAAWGFLVVSGGAFVGASMSVGLGGVRRLLGR